MAALPGVITALVTLFDSALTVPVYDGPTVTGDRPLSYVMVGVAVSGIPGTGSASDAETASFSLELSEMGPGTWENETGEIACSIVAGSGNGDVPAARVIVMALFEQCRDALRADRTLGGVLALNGLGHIGAGVLNQLMTSEGAAASVSFTVPYQTVLTS